MPIEKIFSPTKPKTPNCKITITHKNVTKTVSEWEKETGINQITIRSRLARNMSVEEILAKPKIPKYSKTPWNYKITRNGVTKTAAEWSEELGIKIDTMVKRLRANYSDERLLSPPKRTNEITITLNGETKTIEKWTEETGLNRKAVIAKAARKITYKGVTKTLSEWSKTLGIKKCTIRNRLRFNFPIEKVLSPNTRHTKRTPGKYKIYHNGVTKTVAEWGEELNINHITLYLRLKRGISDEEILAKPQHRKGKTIAEWAEDGSISLNPKSIRGRRLLYVPWGKEITHNGTTKTATMWEQELGIETEIIIERLVNNMPDSQILSKPWTKEEKRLYDVAKRANELTEKTVKELKSELMSKCEDREFVSYKTKGQLIEEILIEEFTS